MSRKYEFDRTWVATQRELGATWDELADHYGCARSTLIEWYRKDPQPTEGPERELFSQEERAQGKVPDLQAIAERFNAGEDFTPTKVSGSFWEQKPGVVLGSLRVAFERSPVADARLAERVFEQAVQDMRTHTPAYDQFKVEHPTRGILVYEDPVAWLESINDAHIGMYAWKHETGKDDYDLNIATRDYENAASQLARMALSYNVEEAIVVLGHDMQHFDSLFNKVAQTTSGTPQDYDSRMAKIITAVRRAAVRQIDEKLAIAGRVTVVIVPGNHDRFSMYHLAETLYAWYRNVPEVTILNGPEDGNYAFPRLRQYYQYGQNGLMLSHGENFKKRDEVPPLIFADEAPQIWAATDYREVLAGHVHKLQVDEIRGTRIRRLPGLTAVDSWHDEQGYSHWRAATGIAYKRSGGVAGIHEVEP